jgi:hypothetical protein
MSVPISDHRFDTLDELIEALETLREIARSEDRYHAPIYITDGYSGAYIERAVLVRTKLTDGSTAYEVELSK